MIAVELAFERSTTRSQVQGDFCSRLDHPRATLAVLAHGYVYASAVLLAVAYRPEKEERPKIIDVAARNVRSRDTKCLEARPRVSAHQDYRRRLPNFSRASLFLRPAGCSPRRREQPRTSVLGRQES